MAEQAIEKATAVVLAWMFDGCVGVPERPTEHHGDCTDEPFTCDLCLHEDAEKVVSAAVIAFLRNWEPSYEMVNRLVVGNGDLYRNTAVAIAHLEAERLERDATQEPDHA